MCMCDPSIKSPYCGPGCPPHEGACEAFASPAYPQLGFTRTDDVITREVALTAASQAFTGYTERAVIQAAKIFEAYLRSGK